MLTIRLAPGNRLRFHALLLCFQIACIALAGWKPAGASAWLAALALGLSSAIGWLRALYILRQIGDTPVSRVASAAQGFVALRGQGRPLSGLPLLSPYNGLPVLWYRVLIEERRDDNWHEVSDEESEACFLLEDDTGTCAIDPAGAELHPAHRDCEIRGDQRVTQWCLLDRETLFVLGDFRTLHGESLTRSEREAVRDILADWKLDRPELLRRFDTNGDGELCETEWEQARAAAQQEARRERIEADQAASVHVVRKPTGSRPYIVSAVKPWRLNFPHRAWCGLHTALFLLACAGLAALARTGFINRGLF
ncbi:hypothetical protein [Viridibacterium curvum]|uniref:EF-hand domain-containing protein n=1 Tax=Viridibacterium curvum TaxID=1101404 RepID=A0ABP9QEG4_9RHOO